MSSSHRIHERVYSSELAAQAGRRVRVAGWLHQRRQLARVTFLIVRDARGLTQVVVEDPEVIARVARLHHESVLEVTGEVVATAQAPGGVEVHRPEVVVLAEAAEPPPFDLFRPRLTAQLPTLLD